MFFELLEGVDGKLILFCSFNDTCRIPIYFPAFLMESFTMRTVMKGLKKLFAGMI